MSSYRYRSLALWHLVCRHGGDRHKAEYRHLRDAIADLERQLAEARAEQKAKDEQYWATVEQSANLEAERDRLATEVARLREAKPQWRPIETAPRDGTKFDAWVPDAFGGHRMTGLSFNQKGKLRQNGLLTEAELPRCPTHWMPLPTSPRKGGSDA